MRPPAGSRVRPIPTRQNTARHEAGHVVAYLHFGVPFVEVKLTDDPKAAERGCVVNVRQGIDARVATVLFLAGPAAVGLPPDGRDLQMAIAAGGPDVATDTSPGSPLSAARELVARHAGLIDIIAAELEKAGRLSYDEVVALARCTGR